MKRVSSTNKEHTAWRKFNRRQWQTYLSCYHWQGWRHRVGSYTGFSCGERHWWTVTVARYLFYRPTPWRGISPTAPAIMKAVPGFIVHQYLICHIIFHGTPQTYIVKFFIHKTQLVRTECQYEMQLGLSFSDGLIIYAEVIGIRHHFHREKPFAVFHRTPELSGCLCGLISALFTVLCDRAYHPKQFCPCQQ